MTYCCSAVITDPEQPLKEDNVYRDFNFEHKLPKADGEFNGEKEDPKGSISIARTAIINIKLDGSDGQDLPDQNSPHAAGVMRLILGTVCRKLARNPSSYASLIGLIWALISARSVFHKYPPICKTM